MLGAALAGPQVTGAGVPADAATAMPDPATPGPADSAPDHTVTLITGDPVGITDLGGGHRSVTVTPAKGPSRSSARIAKSRCSVRQR